LIIHLNGSLPNSIHIKVQTEKEINRPWSDCACGLTRNRIRTLHPAFARPTAASLGGAQLDRSRIKRSSHSHASFFFHRGDLLLLFTTTTPPTYQPTPIFFSNTLSPSYHHPV
jgi:hypothetical protein